MPRRRRALGRRPRPRRDRRATRRRTSARKLLRTLRHGAEPALPEGAARERRAGPRRQGASSTAALGAEVARAQLHNVEHHQAHVASAFFVSPFEDAAILSVDGFGDFASTMLAEGHGNSLRGARARPLPALARDLLHRGHAVARLPALRRRGQGDGPRALRRRRASSTRCASSCGSNGDRVRARPRLLRARQGGRRHDLGRAARRRSAGIFSERLEEVFGAGARARRASSPRCTRTSPRRSRRCSRRPTSTSSRALWERTQHPEPLPRRRRRAERGRERPDPARDAVRGASTSSRRRATPAPRSAPRSTSGTRSSGSPRGFVMEHAYTGPEYSDDGVRGGARRGRASTARAARRRRALRARSPSGSPTATSSAGSRAGWSSARARSATARSSPTRAGPT